jgi:hypothetical protein
MDKIAWLRTAWPLTVVFDRYGGVYSDAEWTAWPLEPAEIPEAVCGNDADCQAWWTAAGDVLVGKGPSPNEAVNGLKRLVSSEL